MFMASKYDIFYVIALKGEMRIVEIVEALYKPKKEYKSIFNHIIELEKEGYVKREGIVKIIHNEKSKDLFRLISFCISNSMNYNLMFKNTFFKFIQKAAKKEFFTIRDIRIHPETFKFYVTALSKYGFILIVSKKPLRCKLLKHHFIIDLMKFFNKKLKFYIPKQHTSINEIKKELKKYKKNLKIYYNIIEDLENKGVANSIYSSLNLEGNPLTLPETQKLVLEEIVPEKYKFIYIQEVINYKKATDLMIANAKRKIRLDAQLILKYHKEAMAHIYGAGEIRKQNVKIKFNPDFKTCEWPLIPLKLDHLIKRYKEFEEKKKDISEIINFASFFHNEFQRIHPFIDGNSRISRLLLLHILRSYGLPVLDLPLGYFDLYLDLTKRSTKRDDETFRYLIEEIIFMNLKRLNEAI